MSYAMGNDNSRHRSSNRRHNNSNSYHNGHDNGYGNGNRGDGHSNFNTPQNRQYQSNRQKYTQKQSFQQQNIEEIADIEMFKEQVHNTFVTIENAATMAQDPQWDESIVNSVTDGALLSLDMFAVSCGEFCKKVDKKAIKLAKKAVTDKWDALKQKDPQTYSLTTAYRDFLIAALNGNKKLRYKQYRVAESQLDFEAREQLKNNPQALHDTYQHLIANGQQFDHEQQEIRNDPNKARQVKEQQDQQLEEFNKNLYYQNQNCRGQSMSNRYKKPKQSDFYFTKSGQNAKFERLHQKREQKDMENELLGVEDAYTKIPKKLKYKKNAMLLLSKQNPLKTPKYCSRPIPCQVFHPSDRTKSCPKIVIRPAKPFDNARMQYPPNMLCFDINKVRDCENRHIAKYNTLGEYKSIAELEEEERRVLNQLNGMDIDNDFV